MVRNVLVVIIGLALLSEGFLVYQNVQLKRRLKLFSSSGAVPEHLQRRICEQLPEYHLPGERLPFVGHTEFQQIVRKSKPRFVVIFFFRISDCGTCVQNEIRLWNRMAQKFKCCQVVGVTQFQDPQRLARSMAIQFPVVTSSNFDSILSTYGIEHTPAIFFGDLQLRRIIYAFLPTAGYGSDQFFADRVTAFLNDCKH